MPTSAVIHFNFIFTDEKKQNLQNTVQITFCDIQWMKPKLFR